MDDRAQNAAAAAAPTDEKAQPVAAQTAPRAVKKKSAAKKKRRVAKKKGRAAKKKSATAVDAAASPKRRAATGRRGAKDLAAGVDAPGPKAPVQPFAWAMPHSQRAAPAGGRALVVVESPAKAKTIKKYLGNGFTVKASVGHVKDLPKSKLSVDLDDHFTPHYEVIRGKSKVIKEIKDAARDADVIYLAPDPDREGEAIAWHLAEEMGRRHENQIYRITFNEITRAAVQAAIARPQALNQRKYESQQARRILDRIVGYQISPILWDKVRRGLSAGRVQSVAVRIIVEREAAVRAFVPEEYWSVTTTARAAQPPPFAAKVVGCGSEKFAPKTGDQAHAAARAIAQAPCIVVAVQRREQRRQPRAPLTTSKLQQEAANRLGFTAKRTMMVAQQLYEGVDLAGEGSVALSTYMRTDSVRVAPSALAAVREAIAATYGADYLPEAPNVYPGKKNAQDAHEAIRPTSMQHPPNRVRPWVTAEQYKLYALVWRTFVASQMRPAIYDQTSVEMQAANYTLRSHGSVIKFAGYLAAMQSSDVSASSGAAAEAQGADASHMAAGEEDAASGDAADTWTQGRGERSLPALPQLQKGDAVALHDVLPQQHFTQPPPRFNESSLVRELEEQGIGRPSTYATILSTIVTRGYVEKQEGRFLPTELGTLVTSLLTESFPQVLDVAFTAQMETLLDDVEEGTADWVEVLGHFYRDGFVQAVEHAKAHMRDVKREATPTAFSCPLCQSTMNIRWGRNGSFLACANYPECRSTRDYGRDANGELILRPEEKTDKRCPTCQSSMLVKRGRFGKFLACEAYPGCSGTRPMPMGIDCPEGCGGYLAERRSKRGRTFYGCSSYPACTFAAWDRPVPGPCPSCAGRYLIRKYSKRAGVSIKCPSKTCDYSRDPELDDADAQAVGGANA